MSYAIIAFTGMSSDTTDFVIVNDNFVIVHGNEIEDMSILVKPKADVKVYWPNELDPISLSRARNSCATPEVDWVIYIIQCKNIGKCK